MSDTEKIVNATVLADVKLWIAEKNKKKMKIHVGILFANVKWQNVDAKQYNEGLDRHEKI